MHKINNNNIPSVFVDNLYFAIHKYSTRFSEFCFKLTKTVNKSKFSIKIRGPKIWNKTLLIKKLFIYF